jgi:hypothetical protein
MPGTLAPGGSTSSLQFSDDPRLDASKVTEMELASLSDFNRIFVDLMLTFIAIREPSNSASFLDLSAIALNLLRRRIKLGLCNRLRSVLGN